MSMRARARVCVCVWEGGGGVESDAMGVITCRPRTLEREKESKNMWGGVVWGEVVSVSARPLALHRAWGQSCAAVNLTTMSPLLFHLAAACLLRCLGLLYSLLAGCFSCSFNAAARNAACLAALTQPMPSVSGKELCLQRMLFLNLLLSAVCSYS